MQCKQCGKWFVAKDIYEQFCSIECFTRAQRDTVTYCPPTMRLYHNGEEVKTIKDFNIKEYNYETSALYSDHA